MNHDQQQRYDKLASTIGRESAVRDELNRINEEIHTAMQALGPLQKKQAELTSELQKIKLAKAEAAMLKQLEPEAVTSD